MDSNYQPVLCDYDLVTAYLTPDFYSRKGSYRWLAPEILNSGNELVPVDADHSEDSLGKFNTKSDVYALGMTIFEVRERFLIPTQLR